VEHVGATGGRNPHTRDERLALINRISTELSATQELDEATERLLREVTATIGAEGASVWLWDPHEPGHLVCQAIFNVGQVLSPEGMWLAPNEGVAGWAASHGTTAVVNAAQKDERFTRAVDQRTSLRTESLVAAPLQTRGNTLGVLEVVNKRQGDFGQEDVFLIETLAASASVAIDNAQLVEELEMRNRDLEAFGHTVAHDIKNSLGLIVGYTEAMRTDIDDLSSEEMARYLGIVGKHGRKAADVVDALLLLAEIREADVETDVLDMSSIVAEVEDRLREAIEERGATLVKPDAWPAALGDPSWVEEVWTNYIDNGLKYGGDPPRIELSAEERGDRVRFWVRDDGEGLSQEQQEELFAPNVHPGSRGQGHGLGLSIVCRIAQKLGGDVGVESAPGEGTGFWFELPADGAS
jgi:signal transduction histidine kinase